MEDNHRGWVSIEHHRCVSIEGRGWGLYSVCLRTKVGGDWTEVVRNRRADRSNRSNRNNRRIREVWECRELREIRDNP